MENYVGPMEWWHTWLPMVALAAALFLGRHLIKSWIVQSVEHSFDQRLEMLKAELRDYEETLKSDLRTKEAEISALREGAMSGRARRAALLDERRIKAVERLWKAVVALGSYKRVSAMMAVVKFEAAAEEAPRNERLRQLFNIVASQVPDQEDIHSTIDNERPFLSPLAWAYFSAYRTIMMGAFLRAKTLEMGLEGANNVIDDDRVKGILKTALPHHSEFIEQHDPGYYHYLLDELEDNILRAILRILEDREVYKEDIEKSAEILREINRAATAG